MSSKNSPVVLSFFGRGYSPSKMLTKRWVSNIEMLLLLDIVSHPLSFSISYHSLSLSLSHLLPPSLCFSLPLLFSPLPPTIPTPNLLSLIFISSAPPFFACVPLATASKDGQLKFWQIDWTLEEGEKSKCFHNFQPHKGAPDLYSATTISCRIPLPSSGGFCWQLPTTTLRWRSDEVPGDFPRVKVIQEYARKESVVSCVLSTNSATACWHEANVGWAYELDPMSQWKCT